jgi:hypothetical protein
MVIARKYIGVSSRSESFIIGQLTPHISVSATSAPSCRRVITSAAAPGRPKQGQPPSGGSDHTQ